MSCYKLLLKLLKVFKVVKHVFMLEGKIGEVVGYSVLICNILKYKVLDPKLKH